jgi:HEPN domain-containing protein
MTVPPESLAEKVAAWMRHVEGDFCLVEMYLAATPSRIPGYLAGFHAQQAAEKALKAILIAFGAQKFPFSHDIRLLLELVSQECAWAAELREAEILTTYATWARYPGPWDNPAREEVERAAALARQVIERVRQELAARGFPQNAPPSPGVA